MGLNVNANLRIKIELNSKGKIDVFGNIDFSDILD
jgi:hypothetical protein